MQTGLSFCRWRCWGWVYKNQYQNEYQIAYPCGYCTCFDNDETRVILTQPLHHLSDSFTRNVSRDLQARRTSCLDKLADLSAGWLAEKKTQRRYAKISTNRKLLSYVNCKVTSNMSEDSPESNYYSKLISRRRKRRQLHWPQERNS
jgi:hypothetical protein